MCQGIRISGGLDTLLLLFHSSLVSYRLEKVFQKGLATSGGTVASLQHEDLPFQGQARSNLRLPPSPPCAGRGGRSAALLPLANPRGVRLHAAPQDVSSIS